jgi:hypothetical protein
MEYAHLLSCAIEVLVSDTILWKFCILLPQILLNGLVAMW